MSDEPRPELSWVPVEEGAECAAGQPGSLSSLQGEWQATYSGERRDFAAPSSSSKASVTGAPLPAGVLPSQLAAAAAQAAAAAHAAAAAAAAAAYAASMAAAPGPFPARSAPGSLLLLPPSAAGAAPATPPGPAVGHHRGRRQTAYHLQVASSLDRLASGTPDLWDSDKVTRPLPPTACARSCKVKAASFVEAALECVARTPTTGQSAGRCGGRATGRPVAPSHLPAAAAPRSAAGAEQPHAGHRVRGRGRGRRRRCRWQAALGPELLARAAVGRARRVLHAQGRPVSHRCRGCILAGTCRRYRVRPPRPAAAAAQNHAAGWLCGASSASCGGPRPACIRGLALGSVRAAPMGRRR